MQLKNLDNKITCGSRFHNVVDVYLQDLKPSVISFVNPFSYIRVVQNSSLVDGIDSYFSDGRLLCILHQWFVQKIERASFDYSSIADSFFLKAIENKLSVALVGSTSNEISIATNKISKKYSSLNICYSRDGYIEDSQEFIEKLQAAKPDIVILGMGTPHQEVMAVKLKHALVDCRLIITCGGFLTQTAIKFDYYHPLIKRFELRWLQRMWMHSHVRKRVAVDYPKFIFRYVLTHLFGK